MIGIVFLNQLGRERGILAEGGGGGDEAKNLFHRPPIFHEGDSQPIEQFGMRGWCTFDAKVLDRGDDAVAKQLGPPAVHGDTRGERILFGHEPLRKAEPIGGPVGLG